MRVCICRESIADIHNSEANTHTHTLTHIYIDVHGEGAKRLKARKAKPNRVENGTNETRQRDASVGAHGVPFLYLSKKVREKKTKEGERERDTHTDKQECKRKRW